MCRRARGGEVVFGFLIFCFGGFLFRSLGLLSGYQVFFFQLQYSNTTFNFSSVGTIQTQ